MKSLDFPTLKAEDIEVRVQNVKVGSGFSLLLYKTARTDAKYLDQVVGSMNWQTKFYELKNTIYCSIGIYNDDTKEWVWKDDAGAETQVEQSKGEASDSFKRAGFKWNIGRELYSSPFIWVKETTENTSKAKYICKEFGCNDKKEINKLEIVNERTGELVFSFGTKNKVAQAPKTTNETDYIALVKDFYGKLPIDRQDKFLKGVVMGEFHLERLDQIDVMVARMIYTKYIANR